MGKSLVSVGKKFTARSWAFVLGIVLLMIGKSSMAAAPVFHRTTVDTTICTFGTTSLDLRYFLTFTDVDGGNDTLSVNSGPTQLYATSGGGTGSLIGFAPGNIYPITASAGVNAIAAGALRYDFASGAYGKVTFDIRVKDGTGFSTITVRIRLMTKPSIGATPYSDQIHVGQSIAFNGIVYSDTNSAGSSFSSTWSTFGSNISVTGAGVVTGNSVGLDTVIYSVSNVCPASVYKRGLNVVTGTPPQITVSGTISLTTSNGSSVTINGTGFNTTPGVYTVYFGGAKAVVNSVTSGTINVTIPAGATYGALQIIDSTSQLVTLVPNVFVPRHDSAGFIQSTATNTYNNSFVKLSLPGVAGPYSVEMIDLDGDGDNELVVSGTGTNNIIVFNNLNTYGRVSASSFSATPMLFPVAAGPLSLKFGDFDGDGKLDIASVAVGASQVSVLRNTSTTGSISFATRFDIGLPGALPSELTVADFNKDGRPDIAVAMTGANDTATFTGTGYVPSTNEKYGRFIVIQNNYNKTPGEFIHSADFAVSTAFLYDSTSAPISIAAGDLDGDSKPDVAISVHHDRKVDVFRNTSSVGGNIAFSASPAFSRSTADGGPGRAAQSPLYGGPGYDYTLYRTGYPNQLRIGDLDGDGMPDLAIAVTDSDLRQSNQYNLVAIARNISSVGTISFGNTVTLSTNGAAPVALAIGDLTGDAQPEIVISNSGGSTVGIFTHTAASGFGYNAVINKQLFPSIAGPFGTPVCPAIGDIDGNGIADLAIASRADTAVYLFRTYPRPDTTTPVGDSVLCNGGTGKVYSTHRPTSATGTWTVTSHGHVTITGINSSTVGSVVTDTVKLNGATTGTDTLTYTVINLGDTNRVKYPVRTLATSDPGTITIVGGGDSICVGFDKTFTTTGSGGTWSSVFPTVATIVSATGIAHGVSAGVDTVKYTISGCPAVARFTVRVIGAPVAGAIIGTDTVCALDTMHIATGTHGGNWTSRHGLVSITMSVTHDSAFVSRLTSSTSGLDTLDYNIGTDCGSANSFHPIFVSPDVVGGTITGTNSLCVGGTTSLTISSGATTGVWSSSNPAIATVSPSGVVTALSAGPGPGPGTATISYTSANHCGSVSSTFVVSVNATVGTAQIVTPASTNLCVGSTMTLTLTASSPTGGTWASRSNAIATVGSSSGAVGGASAGTVSIVYTSAGAGGCGVTSDSIAINVLPLPVAGTITGSMGGAYDSLCANHAPVTFVNTGGTPAGTWTALNPAVASVDGAGTVTITLPTGAADTTTIKYTTDASYACGTAQVGRVIKVKKMPNAGVLTGPAAQLCFPGVTGHPSTAVITNSVAHTTGIWGSVSVGAEDADAVLNALATTTTSASFFTSATTAAGADPYHTTHVFFVDTNFCGRDSVSLQIGVNTVPNPGVITTTGGPAGLDSMCSPASTTGHTTLGQVGTPNTSANPAGSAYFTFAWTRSNPTVLSFSTTTAANTTLNGLVAGRDTITYSVTNVCGTGSVNRQIRVLAPASAGFIVAPDVFCAPATTFVYDTLANGDTATEGTWGSLGGGLFISNVSVAFGQTDVSPSPVTNTIIFTPTPNYCGALTTTKDVTISNYPYAGIVSGDTTVCVGAQTTLTDDPGNGDLWYSADPATASVDLFGVVTGNVGGTTQIFYVANSANCGSDTTDAHTMIVKSLSPVGFIFGQDTSCINGTAQLYDTVAIAAGGTWSSSNSSIASIDATTGFVTAGATGGQATITYSTSNGCGPNDTTITFRVFDIPRLTSSTTPPQTCDSAHFTYNATADTAGTHFAWTRADVANILPSTANADTSYIDEYLDNVGNTTVLNAVYVYTMTAHGCTNNASVTVQVIPTPKLTSPLFDTICSGQTFVYTDVESTGPTTTANWTRPSIGLINSGAAGAGSHGISEVLTSDDHSNGIVVSYIYTLGFMGCPTHTETLSVLVDPSAVSPSITTHSENALCEGTMYQNFGTNIAAPAGNTYTWSAKNAQVWATGSTREYCLVNFTQASDAMVYLNASVSGFNCPTSDSFAVTVSTAQSDKPEVTYFNGDFVCLSNTEDTYQWGYDDRSTLDSALFVGETNQNFYVPVPDFTTKYYFVMTTHNGCTQKSYFIVPTGVQNVTANMGDMKVYPNPANNYVNVEINNTSGGKYTVEVVDLLGHKLNTSELVNNKTTVDVNDLAAGMYMINCYREGVKFASAKFVKN